MVAVHLPTGFCGTIVVSLQMPCIVESLRKTTKTASTETCWVCTTLIRKKGSKVVSVSPAQSFYVPLSVTDDRSVFEVVLWMHLFPMCQYPRLYRQRDIANFAIRAKGCDLDKGRVHARHRYSHINDVGKKKRQQKLPPQKTENDS
jgi:hypothetical protein